VYFLLAKKRVHSMRLIMPSWKERLAAQGRIAPAAQKELTQRHSQKESELV